MEERTKKPLTVKEFASLGGHARKKALTAAQRKKIARKAGKAGGRGRKKK